MTDEKGSKNVENVDNESEIEPSVSEKLANAYLAIAEIIENKSTAGKTLVKLLGLDEKTADIIADVVSKTASEAVKHGLTYRELYFKAKEKLEKKIEFNDLAKAYLASCVVATMNFMAGYQAGRETANEIIDQFVKALSE